MRSCRVWVAPALALSWLGCTSLGGMPTATSPSKSEFEDFAGDGQLPVYGARPSDPGPELYRRAEAIPRLTNFLRGQGFPDYLEVEGRRGRDLQVVLTYARASNPPKGRIVLEQTGDGRWFARSERAPRPRSSEPPQPPSRPPPRLEKQEELPSGGEAAADEPTPAIEEDDPDCSAELPLATATQQLDCPIEPEREDCARLCRSCEPYEWCP